MLIWYRLAIGVSVFGGLLVSLNYSLPQADSEDAAARSAISARLGAVKVGSRPTVSPETGPASDTTKAFIRMRAALATAKLRARELTSYTALLEMQEEVNGNLVNRIHEFYAARDDWSSALNCSVSQSSETENVVTEYCLQFRDKSVSPEYLESRLSFDEATGLLIVVQNFGWTDEESPRIVEHYAWREINQAAALCDSDFDESNAEYEFVAR